MTPDTFARLNDLHVTWRVASEPGFKDRIWLEFTGALAAAWPEISARLAPVAVGGVDLERWRALIAEYDAGPKHWPDEEQPCRIDLAEARAVVAGLDRLARYEGAAPALLQMYEDDPEYAAEWPAIHHLRHVQAGEWNPDCAGCTAEPGQRVERWTCGRGHIVEIPAGTPPAEMGTCPVCAALERAERVEAAARWYIDVCEMDELGDLRAALGDPPPGYVSARLRADHTEAILAGTPEKLEAAAKWLDLLDDALEALALTTDGEARQRWAEVDYGCDGTHDEMQRDLRALAGELRGVRADTSESRADIAAVAIGRYIQRLRGDSGTILVQQSDGRTERVVFPDEGDPTADPIPMRAEAVETAARRVHSALVAGLASTDADGLWDVDQWVAFMDAARDLSVALGAEPEEEVEHGTAG